MSAALVIAGTTVVLLINSIPTLLWHRAHGVNPEVAQRPIEDLDTYVDAVVKDLKKGTQEICPGQSGQLRLMSRLAPGFIRGQLAKGSKNLIPANAH